jgi:hypothetical protein
MAELSALLSTPHRVPGWATVDLDRAEVEVADAYRSEGPARVRPAADDDLLGARSRLVEFSTPSRVVLLEPRTEGRIAASLARFGEGIVAIYVIVDEDFDEVVERVGRAIPLSAEAPGPFGRQRLVASSPRWGAHLVLAANARQRADNNPAVTIER